MTKPRPSPVTAAALARDLDSAFFKALADPTRIAIVMQLASQGAQDVDSIAAAFPQDRSVISRHLQLLHEAGVLARQPEGRRVVYRLEGARVIERLEGLVALMRAAMDSCCPPAPPEPTPDEGDQPAPARRARRRGLAPG